MTTVEIERKNNLEKELERIKKIIVEKYQPEKIILFGSLAEGRVHKWSDIDLVIIKETNERFIQRLHDVRFIADARVGVDYVVYTPEEFEKMKKENNYFITDEIIKKGKVVYG